MAKKDNRKATRISPLQDRWYYLQPGQTQPVGPLSLEQLRTLVEDNLLHKKTKVWHRGMFNWADMSDVKELKVHRSLFALAFPSIAKALHRKQPGSEAAQVSS
jgi:hypothetical protein